MDGMDVGYLGALVGGLLSFLSPCVLPLVPPYLCFLSGLTFDELTARGAAGGAVFRRVVLSALAFVFGFAVVFVSLGAVASAISGFISDYREPLARIAGILIALLGLHFMGVFRIRPLLREARFHVPRRPPGLFGAFVIGLAFAFGWTPCVGPVLAAVLAVAASRETALEGAGLLSVYALGMGIPFLAAALAINPFLGLFRKLQPHLGKIEFVMGVLLVATGGAIFTGVFNEAGFWLLEVFPGLGRLG